MEHRESLYELHHRTVVASRRRGKTIISFVCKPSLNVRLTWKAATGYQLWNCHLWITLDAHDITSVRLGHLPQSWFESTRRGDVTVLQSSRHSQNILNLKTNSSRIESIRGRLLWAKRSHALGFEFSPTVFKPFDQGLSCGPVAYYGYHSICAIRTICPSVTVGGLHVATLNPTNGWPNVVGFGAKLMTIPNGSQAQPTH